MGLPEVLFNLFPGMGAYSFLTRTVGNPLRRIRWLPAARSTPRKYFWTRWGFVDVLAEDGEGIYAVRDYLTLRLQPAALQRAGVVFWRASVCIQSPRLNCAISLTSRWMRYSVLRILICVAWRGLIAAQVTPSHG